MKLTAKQMVGLPEVFKRIRDPRRGEGRRHQLPTVLSISTAAVLGGAKGFKGISDWAKNLGQKARERLNCRYDKKGRQFIVPSESTIRNVLIRVDADEVDKRLGHWILRQADTNSPIAIDGKTMCGAVGDNGRRVHIISAVLHNEGICITQKK
jgi:hypothetical protein